MRAMTIVIPLSVMLSLAAAAQDRGRTSSGQTTTPPAGATGQAGTQAPVGHRQPTQSGLPPAVRGEEDARRQPADPLGPVPKICSKC